MSAFVRAIRRYYAAVLLLSDAHAGGVAIAISRQRDSSVRADLSRRTKLHLGLRVRVSISDLAEARLGERGEGAVTGPHLAAN